MQTDPTEDYARGWIPFFDCTIYLDSRPLIPRSETEYWVEKAAAEMYAKAPAGREMRVLDLFAGSGAIGVAILKHVPGSFVDFGEIDPLHLPTIEKNVRENGIDPERARIIETDLWSAISNIYDYILTNPPYLSKSHTEAIQTSVLAHEPGKALFADENGLSLIRKTIEGARMHLAPQGVLYIEHDPEQAPAIAAIAGASGFSVETHKDQFERLRYSRLSLVA